MESGQSRSPKRVAFQEGSPKNEPTVDPSKVSEQVALFNKQVKTNSIQTAFDILLKGKSKSVVLKTKAMISEGSPNVLGKRKPNKRGITA